MNENNMGINDMSAPRAEKSHGALIGSIVIVILLAVAGFYYWNTTMKSISMERKADIQSAQEDATTINTLQVQGTSYEVSDIEMDLSATNIDSINTSISQ
ncbi:hypothetical protein IT403_02310 [Candidatus Nomurabacteria bacterium]|nr:hypothetical protein [Candidatus Nomurabacteria bacterium]